MSGGETKFITDTNRHGIRREYPAVGYKAVKALNKRNKDAKQKTNNSRKIQKAKKAD